METEIATCRLIITIFPMSMGWSRSRLWCLYGYFFIAFVQKALARPWSTFEILKITIKLKNIQFIFAIINTRDQFFYQVTLLE